MTSYEKERAERKEWLAGLKAGDRVGLSRGYSAGHYPATVVRRTPGGQIVVNDGPDVRTEQRFNADGNRRVSGYDHRKIEPWTQERADEHERVNLAARLRYETWHEKPLSVLRSVAAALDADATLAVKAGGES